MRQLFICFIYVIGLTLSATQINAQDNHSGHNHDHSHHNHNHDHSGHNHGHDHSGHNHSHDHSGHNHAAHGAKSHEHGHSACGGHDDHHADVFDPAGTAFHHIADANVYSIGPLQLPLPCILYAPDHGVSTFMSSTFGIGHHGTGENAVDRYVLDEGTVKRVKNPRFPMEKVHIDGFVHKKGKKEGKEVSLSYVCYKNDLYELENKSTMDGGLFGGGITSYYDFSITKNVATMLIVCLFLFWMFLKVTKAYREREGKAPTGMQGFVEPIFVFIQDEVAKPFLGAKWEKYTPFLMSLFFFILGLNLFGQVPFFGGSNPTGNLGLTMALAVIAFFVVNLSGNKHYWEHIFWMPGVPAFVKTILTPVEFLGVFIKPITLMLRLFANITAGHMVIIIFIGLIFTFGNMGTSPAAGYAAAIPATFLTLFMMAIELLVAFLQAFVFTILTASYLGAAVEEHDHAH